MAPSGVGSKASNWRCNCVNNLLNRQGVYFQDDRVTLRAPDGDVTQRIRESIADKNAVYQQPVSFILTTTLKL